MGSWNKTCGLSNLHITAGSDVYVFVLVENTDKTDRCYSTAFWEPCLVPFASKYDDYGGGEESSGPALSYIMAALKSELVEIEQGANSSHDIPVKREAFDEGLFFEAVHESRLFVPGYRVEKRMVDFVMMRKDVVDYILENRVIERYVGDGAGTHGYGNNYINYKFADILADIPEFLDEIERKTGEHTILKEKLAELLKDPEANAKHIQDLSDLVFELVMHRGLDEVFPWRHPNKVSHWVSGHDSHRFFRLCNIGLVIAKLAKSGSRAEAEALLIEHLKACYINGYMESIRKNWSPGGHEGSQSANSDDYRLLAATYIAVLDAEDARYKAEYGEDDCEDEDDGEDE